MANKKEASIKREKITLRVCTLDLNDDEFWGQLVSVGAK